MRAGSLTLILLSATLLAAGLSPARAQMFGPGYRPCGEQPNTRAIVDCVEAKTKEWDRRLNAAYAALLDRIAPAQRVPLRDAERAWLAFREANCRFYDAQEGTIRQIQAAECLRAMTEARTRELEQAMKFD